MALTDARKAALKIYCRLDDLSDGEVSLLETIYAGAVDYMTNAGVSEPTDEGRKASYDLCVNALVLDAWDNRNPIVEQAATVDNPAFRRRLNQLKLTEPVPDSGTGTGA